MAANHHPSPTVMQMQQQQQHHHQQAPPPPPPGHQQGGHYAASPASHPIAAVNEAVWLQIGSFSELLRVPDEAMHAYERALQANPNSTQAMNAIGMLLKGRDQFDKALEFFRAIVQVEPTNGEAWGNLGHCYLMSELLQKAYDAYQQALIHLPTPKDPMLWYGIGILYDRYGSYDYAQEAFSEVMKIQPSFDKANEIYFRLGIIYKQQLKFAESLECFKYIVSAPPVPLSQDDIWFQIGHVHEQQKEFEAAKNAYNRVLENTPNHAKVLQQLGWLHHQQSNAYETQERAIQYLEKSVGADQQDAQSWYLLGRCYMSQQKYPKAYEAYQQAVYRDGRNPTFWCSIGVLYYQINQYRDALDAYSRAIRLNPYISEVWYDLGTLYESCNNQITDALDAYQRAAELDPGNPHIKARLQLLRSGPTNGQPPPAAPQPADVHPHAYQASGPPGPSWTGPVQQPPNGEAAHTPQGSAPGEGFAGRLSNVNPPSQPPNPLERPSDYRQGAPSLQRQPTPQQDQHMRQGYNELLRGPPRRGPSPPPGHQYGQHPQPPQSQGPAHQPMPDTGRVANPNYAGATPSVPQANGATPFRATNSPRPDGRPPTENQMPSPKSAYPQHQPMYPPQQEAGPPRPAEGGPPPPAVAEQRTESRPGSAGPKRMREWEEERDVKKPANEENRARLEDARHRRPSTPSREGFRRNSSEVRRTEEQRREEQRRQDEPRHPHDAYHPSEAAHHQANHAVPQGPSSVASTPHEKPRAAVTPKEEHSAAEQTPASQPPAAPAPEPERAARKMDVDEDYDDSGDDDKKATVANGASSVPAETNTSPTSGSANGGSAPAKTD